ncbi:hypothetical protein Syun_022024 [Stephania yunnanensis]|uniref:Uncharacterized protein n=1 Tax=Stephania yunnanensis TaxID=152371 RepID=A0AAP0IH21_9MAGN
MAEECALDLKTIARLQCGGCDEAAGRPAEAKAGRAESGEAPDGEFTPGFRVPVRGIITERERERVEHEEGEGEPETSREGRVE